MQQQPICLFADATPARDGEKITGFSGIAYSGGVVPNYGWRGDMAIDLASMQQPGDRVPITFGHNDDDVEQTVGWARVVNDGQTLTLADGRFSAATESGRKVAALMAEGQPFMFSVGVNGRAFDADKAKPTTLNGRALPVDTVLRDTRLLHVSFVHAGADPHAHAARLSARMGVQPQTEQSMADAQPDPRIAELEAQVQTLTTERDDARRELATLAVNARNAEIVALFGEDNDLTDAQLAAYRGMTPEQFAAVRDALAATSRADPTLFTQQATQGRNHEQGGGERSFRAPAGFSVDESQAQLHAKALAYMAAHPNTDYVAAVMAAQGA